MKLLSRYYRLSKQSFVRFLYGVGPLATSLLASPLRDQKSLSRSLRNSFNSIPRWFQWVFFQSFVFLLAIFLDCSSSPSLSANFEAHSLQKDFVFFFRLEVVYENGQAFFFFFRGIHFQNPGKNSEFYTCRPRFLSDCMISLVQQRHAYQL